MKCLGLRENMGQLEQGTKENRWVGQNEGTDSEIMKGLIHCVK